ncbi:MAG: helix-turn-helix domain-containing protein [Rhodobacteraceae bacterium]|nr:helix-turn-helix domain-containing protein [Paracoccaceae bacterium]MBR9823757.1 helix-turn-helix domain-containing protein [Paracoccaceae bacterium]
MRGFKRYSTILRLFSPQRPNWTVSEISQALDTPSSSIYRTMRELSEEGFVEASADAHYRLGSAFIEFDRMMRKTDPLVLKGAPLLQSLIEQAELPCVCVLARLYGDRVICAVDEKTGNTAFSSSYERGLPMPVLYGATSKAILAHLPKRRLDAMLSDAPDDAARSALLSQLKEIRRTGYCVTRGEVDAQLVGLAAPVVNKDLAIWASVSMIVNSSDLTEEIEARITLTLVTLSQFLAQKLTAYSAGA